MEISKSEKKWNTNRMPPTSTVTSAAAIVFATLNVLESTTLILPPSVLVAFTLDRAKVYGSGVLFGMAMSVFTSSGGGAANRLDNINPRVSRIVRSEKDYTYKGRYRAPSTGCGRTRSCRLGSSSRVLPSAYARANQ